ncbi:MAG: PAS domain-containing protein [Candidatus Paceibacterota bacterium]|jgi:PAS domain S-box-containing protein
MDGAAADKMNEIRGIFREFYDTIFDVAPAGVFVYDISIGMIESNRKASELFGGGNVEHLNILKLSFASGKDRDQVEKILKNTSKEGSADVEIIAGNGNGTRLRIDLIRLGDENSNIRLGTVCPISFFENRKEEIEVMEKMYYSLFERCGDMIWILSGKGDFVYFNKKAEEVSGYKLAKYVGKSFVPFIVPEYLARLQEIFFNTMSGKIISYDVGIVLENGTIALLRVDTLPMYRDGMVIGTVSFGKEQQKK